MIELSHVNVSFRSERQEKVFGVTRIPVLKDVSVKIPKGQCLGILGESGSGKSTLGRVLCGLLKPDNGAVSVDNLAVYGSRRGKKLLQSKLSVVFQDYTTSANPRFRVRDVLMEGLRAADRKRGRTKKAEPAQERLEQLLEQVGLDEAYLKRFPHELSGGQLQRVCIARAVACEPEVILFDEAISSLDAHTQVQIMDLLRELKEKLNLTYVFITHDLTSVTYLCDEVLFLYKGQVTERLPVDRLAETKDEYARKLLGAIITYDAEGIA